MAGHRNARPHVRPKVIEGELVARTRPPAVVDGAVEAVAGVVEGQVVRVIEIERYPQASTALGGCPSFIGRYVTDQAEIAAIARRVGGGR
jgi:hypothetical protein